MNNEHREKLNCNNQHAEGKGYSVLRIITLKTEENEVKYAAETSSCILY